MRSNPLVMMLFMACSYIFSSVMAGVCSAAGDDAPYNEEFVSDSIKTDDIAHSSLCIFENNGCNADRFDSACFDDLTIADSDLYGGSYLLGNFSSYCTYPQHYQLGRQYSVDGGRGVFDGRTNKRMANLSAVIRAGSKNGISHLQPWYDAKNEDTVKFVASMGIPTSRGTWTLNGRIPSAVPEYHWPELEPGMIWRLPGIKINLTKDTPGVIRDKLRRYQLSEDYFKKIQDIGTGYMTKMKVLLYTSRSAIKCWN